MKLWNWLFKRDSEPRRTEGTEARERAEQALTRTLAETPKYEALGESLKRIRERNHLTEAFLEIHRGRG